ncbi:hypothetical protein ABIC33_006517 [Variovorax sp. 1140]
MNLARGRILHDVAAHAGKSAEQIARVAGMIYVLESHTGQLQVETLERARLIVYWHMDQFLAQFGKNQPGDQRVIDSGVIMVALRQIGMRNLGFMARNEVKKWCAKPLSNVRFDQALQMLIDQQQVWLQKRGRTVLIAGNFYAWR